MAKPCWPGIPWMAAPHGNGFPLPAENPLEIYSAADPARIFWENGTCTSSGTCTRNGVNASGLDGSSMEFLPGAQKAAFSSDGRWLVYEERSTAEKSELTLATTDLKDRRKMENIGNSFLDFSWSPDGSKLSVLTLDRSEYSGKWSDVRNLVITTEGYGHKDLAACFGHQYPRSLVTGWRQLAVDRHAANNRWLRDSGPGDGRRHRRRARPDGCRRI